MYTEWVNIVVSSERSSLCQGATRYPKRANTTFFLHFYFPNSLDNSLVQICQRPWRNYNLWIDLSYFTSKCCLAGRSTLSQEPHLYLSSSFSSFFLEGHAYKKHTLTVFPKMLLFLGNALFGLTKGCFFQFKFRVRLVAEDWA